MLNPSQDPRKTRGGLRFNRGLKYQDDSKKYP